MKYQIKLLYNASKVHQEAPILSPLHGRMLVHETILWKEPTTGTPQAAGQPSGWMEIPIIPVQCDQAPPLREKVAAEDAQTLKYKCHVDTDWNIVDSRVPVSDLTYIRVRSGLTVLQA